MKINIFRVKESANGYILYQREKTKVPGYAPWPKYFINNPITQDYFKEFKTRREALKVFNSLSINR